MPRRYLLSVVLGAMLVFVWGGFAWAGGLYNRFLHPLPGGEATLRAFASVPASGMYVYPSEAPLDSTVSPEAREAAAKTRLEQGAKGPIVMAAISKEGFPQDDPRMLVRGFLIELFATSMLVAVLGLAGSGHGRLRRFLALQAMVAFMALSTHMIFWAFMNAPNDWTAVLVFDSWIGWTLAGLPAVFLMRAMREGDASAA
jgi:hypothetical protein